MVDYETEDTDAIAALIEEGEKEQAAKVAAANLSPAEKIKAFDLGDVEADEDEAEPELFSMDSGVDLTKPWMKHHKFELVTTLARVRELVDRALKVGRMALDLETEGFDNRIEYDGEGKPYTRHKIVGYCFGIEGEGFYIPVRHQYNKTYDKFSPNVNDVTGTELEIKRLCEAAQPVISEEGLKSDPFGSHDMISPPKVVIDFWHSKFDQEFLYPITGIDFWHPESFEDGLLANYVIYTDDDHGLKENALRKLEPVQGHRYEMIRFEDLFPKGMKKNERRFYNLYPRKEGEGWNTVLYGCSDGICTDLLCRKLVPVANDKKYRGMYRIEKQVVQVVRILERNRVLIDKNEIVLLLKEAEDELAEYEQKIVKLAKSTGFPNFNPSSASQLAEFLFESRGLNLNPKPEKTSGGEGEGQYKTDEKTLDALHEENQDSEVLLWIIKHRQITKVKGTYLQNLANNTDELDQLRLNFRQTGASTGRFTAPKGDADHGFAGVPMQGIPARDDPKKPKVAHSLRRTFIARKGYKIVKVDYASQELRIASNVSGERKWIAEYEKEAQTGEPADLHYLTAQAFYPGLSKENTPEGEFKMKRNAGKTANFALVYGGGVGAVQRATGCDKVEGARLKKAFDDSVPFFSKWVKKQHKIVKEQLGVRTPFGRFIAIPGANVSPEEIIERLRKKAEAAGKEFKVTKEIKKEAWQQSKKEQSACERKSTNFPIQGAGADILKLSLVMLAKELALRGWLKTGNLGGDDSVRLIMTVHDEVVFEIKDERLAEAIPIILKIMEYPSRMVRWAVPLVAEAEIGSSWAAKLNWLKMLKGDAKSPAPDYINVQSIDRDPVLLIGVGTVTATAPKATLKVEAPKEATEDATEDDELPEVDDDDAVEAVASEAPVKAAAVEAPAGDDGLEAALEAAANDEIPKISAPVKQAPKENSAQYVTFTLGRYLVDKNTVCSIYMAVEFSKVEAFRIGKEDEMVPVEFRNCNNEVLYSAKENYLAYPTELSRRFVEYGLGSGTFEVLSF